MLSIGQNNLRLQKKCLFWLPTSQGKSPASMVHYSKKCFRCFAPFSCDGFLTRAVAEGIKAIVIFVANIIESFKA